MLHSFVYCPVILSSVSFHCFLSVCLVVPSSSVSRWPTWWSGITVDPNQLPLFCATKSDPVSGRLRYLVSDQWVCMIEPWGRPWV